MSSRDVDSGGHLLRLKNDMFRRLLPLVREHLAGNVWVFVEYDADEKLFSRNGLELF